jgi:hypothetical protein
MAAFRVEAPLHRCLGLRWPLAPPSVGAAQVRVSSSRTARHRAACVVRRKAPKASADPSRQRPGYEFPFFSSPFGSDCFDLGRATESLAAERDAV